MVSFFNRFWYFVAILIIAVLVMITWANYKFVQEQLGHASITTTQVYAGVVESEGRKAVEKMRKEE